mmetsp:Transcript_37623/g.73691  ORF Transcript_37623/g.73691 Transcript_37623/m.73691 type:complete len:119 (+) Transcript_37623:598-954(+)
MSNKSVRHGEAAGIKAPDFYQAVLGSRHNCDPCRVRNGEKGSNAAPVRERNRCRVPGMKFEGRSLRRQQVPGVDHANLSAWCQRTVLLEAAEQKIVGHNQSSQLPPHLHLENLAETVG